MGNGYHLLVLLHLIFVVGAIGALSYNGLYLLLARRQSPGTAGAVLGITAQVALLGELLFYAGFIFGLAAVGASHSTWKFSQAWVSAAFALFLVEVAILHAWIRPHQRQYQAALSTEPPVEAAGLSALEKRVAAGWGAFNVLVVVIIYLMVFKPGGPGS